VGLGHDPLVDAKGAPVSKTAFLFPGQGAQTPGMGKDFAEGRTEAAAIFAEANDVLGYDLRKLCFEGPADELTLTTHAQPAIFTCSVAVATALRAAGKAEASAAAGLSLGEYTALWFAGAFDFAAGLKLVKRRGAAMQAASENPKSGMVSLLGADRATAEKVAEKARGAGVLVAANFNAPGQIVLSGDLDACGRVPAAAKELGVRRAIPLQVAGAFHSPLMPPPEAELRLALAETDIRDPKIPVVANATAAPLKTAADVRAALNRQITSPVLWEDSMRTLSGLGCSRFVEPAPGSVLCGLAKKILDGVEVVSYDKFGSFDAEASA
jgi:[acyl-carrier-protein] S-malonyltransferase